jgi:Kef-type K+ transport system membrane component KefB
MRWLDAFRTGALMNTRGLTELVVLNIGLSAGLIGGQMYTVLVLMALILTAMTGPLPSWADLRGGVTAIPGRRAGYTHRAPKYSQTRPRDPRWRTRGTNSGSGRS